MRPLKKLPMKKWPRSCITTITTITSLFGPTFTSKSIEQIAQRFNKQYRCCYQFIHFYLCSLRFSQAAFIFSRKILEQKVSSISHGYTVRVNEPFFWRIFILHWILSTIIMRSLRLKVLVNFHYFNWYGTFAVKGWKYVQFFFFHNFMNAIE